MGLDSVGAADLGLLSVGVRRGRNFGGGPRETLDFSAANNWQEIYVIICGGRGNGMSIMIDLPPAMAQEARGVRRSATRKSENLI